MLAINESNWNDHIHLLFPYFVLKDTSNWRMAILNLVTPSTTCFDKRTKSPFGLDLS